MVVISPPFGLCLGGEDHIFSMSLLLNFVRWYSRCSALCLHIQPSWSAGPLIRYQWVWFHHTQTWVSPLLATLATGWYVSILSCQLFSALCALWFCLGNMEVGELLSLFKTCPEKLIVHRISTIVVGVGCRILWASLSMEVLSVMMIIIMGGFIQW